MSPLANPVRDQDSTSTTCTGFGCLPKPAQIGIITTIVACVTIAAFFWCCAYTCQRREERDNGCEGHSHELRTLVVPSRPRAPPRPAPLPFVVVFPSPPAPAMLLPGPFIHLPPPPPRPQTTAPATTPGPSTSGGASESPRRSHGPPRMPSPGRATTISDRASDRDMSESPPARHRGRRMRQAGSSATRSWYPSPQRGGVYRRGQPVGASSTWNDSSDSALSHRQPSSTGAVCSNGSEDGSRACE